MSSFVIGKQEYIKAAGLMAGLAQSLELWVWDYQTRRNMTPEDYHRRFTECFEMNCLSVQEQYDDESVYTDSNDYMDLFKVYQKYGKSIGISREGLKEAAMELRQFFSSSRYQTEKESYMFKMDMFYDKMLVALMKHLVPGYEPESWGEFTIQEPNRVVEPLF